MSLDVKEFPKELTEFIQDILYRLLRNVKTLLKT